MELTLEQALQKGIEAHKAGQVQHADRYYTAVLQASPKHPDANHNMGLLAVGVGKVQEALPFFKNALDVNPNIAQFWLSYIDALIKLDRIADAKVLYEQATSIFAKGDMFSQMVEKKLIQSLQINEDQIQKHILDKAREFRENGRYNEAIDFLKIRIKDFPEDPNIFAILTHCYILNDNLEQGIIYLNKTKNINPKIPSVGWNESRLLLKQNKVEQALIVAQNTSKLFPDDIEGMVILGSCLRATGAFEESLKYLNRAIEVNPNYTEALIQRGLISLTKDDRIGALKDLEKAHHLKLHIKQIWDLVIKLKIELEEFEDTITLAKNMMRFDPFNEKICANIAFCYQLLKNYDQAVTFYKKAIEIKPEYVEAYNNMGASLKDQGKLEEALKAYKKALSIKPDFAELYNNMGNVFKDQGKLEEALAAYNKVVSMNPDFAEAYINMGLVLFDQGRINRAIEVYKKALLIKPDNAQAWINIYFPLQARLIQQTPARNLSLLYPKDCKSYFSRVEKSILHYRLHRGQASEEHCIDQVLGLLSRCKNIDIQNPSFVTSLNDQIFTLPDKMVALLHFGRSGTGLMHSLIDGHPEIITLPSIYFSEYFDQSTWQRITSAGWDKMIDHFISLYEVLFNASSSAPVNSINKQQKKYLGVNHGMANVGVKRNEVLSVDKQIFSSEMKRLMAFYKELDAFIFFKLVHVAFSKAIKDLRDKTTIFYHIHNPDTNARLNFSRFSPDTKWIMMVREPLQSCESWIRSPYQENKYAVIVNRICTMLSEIDSFQYRKQKSVGVRLEDLKQNPKELIPVLCKWIDIEENDSLYKMTAQGKKWWGDPNSPDHVKDGMNPFGKVSIKRNVGSIFSENDQFILSTLFYPFSVRFGYTEENEVQFKANLKIIRPMINEMFDFEKKIVDRMEANSVTFSKAGSYLYFRSCLLERWEILNKYHTYPNMIEPLKINLSQR